MVQNDNLDKYLNEFINNVFNYYNGKINKTVNAILKIDWMIYPSYKHVFGEKFYPNFVIIYAGSIRQYCDNFEELKMQVIVTVIHELFHVDQNINVLKIGIDKHYINHIENAVEFMTSKFIVDNNDDIYNRFGVDMSTAQEYDPFFVIPASNKLIQDTDAWYIKASNKDMIVNMIVNLCKKDSLYKTLHEFMNLILYGMLDVSVKLILNGHSMIIQTPEWIVSANQVAEFINDVIGYVPAGTMSKVTLDPTKTDSNTIVIDIKYTPINPMVKSVFCKEGNSK